MASVDYFLKIDGIQGESLDAKHKDEIRDLVLQLRGQTQSGSFAFGGGGGAGKVQMQDFHFMMDVNKASPKLFLACANGEHIKDAILTARKAGKDQQDYLKITFGDLLVSSFQTNGSGRIRRFAAGLDLVQFREDRDRVQDPEARWHPWCRTEGQVRPQADEGWLAERSVRFPASGWSESGG